MLEPQSTLFFLLLLAGFAGALWWLLATRHLILRAAAALLAFASATMFGVAVVNRYYDYYQTWGAAADDLTSQGVAAEAVQGAVLGGVTETGTGFGALTAHHIDTAIARKLGLTLSLTVHGQVSKITRTVYVFLPPQYFWRGFYQKYHFPVIELIHGFPGQPSDWITVLGVNTLLDSLVRKHLASPAVLVMPDANGARGVSLQCLNQYRGPQDDTFLSRDLPAGISRDLRVQRPGTGWGIAGYSEGGFCAANLGLQHGRVYSFAGVLSGYFRPSDNQLGNPPREISAFGGSRAVARDNTPADLIRALPAGRPIPQFWLGAGLLDADDVRSARYFGQLLGIRQPAVTVRLVPGGGHTMLTWRLLLPPMLTWMTRGLAEQVELYDSPAARARRAAAGRWSSRRHRSRVAIMRTRPS